MNQKHQTIWTPEFLRGNPVTGEKTMKVSLSSKIYFARFDLGWGNNPLQFTLGEHKLHLYNLIPDINRKGLQPLQAYYVGPSTTLPPWNDK